MPHFHKIEVQGRNLGKRLARARSMKEAQDAGRNVIYAAPDPLAPLFDNRNHVSFSHNRIPGRVFHQLAEAGSASVHPDQFYVEFPEESGDLTPVSITKLIAISTGERMVRARRFSLRDAANALSAAGMGVPFSMVIRAARP